MTDATNSEVTYGSYLLVDDLLTLQQPRSTPEHPDELLFIVVHQASELWFKVMLHEMHILTTHLGNADTLASLTSMRRINALMRIVASQLSALDTLPPQRFIEFRGYLGTASGGQSHQFRAIEAASGLRDEHFMHVLQEHGPLAPIVVEVLNRPPLQDLFLGLLEKHGTTLDAVYLAPEQSTHLLLAESLIEYEQGFGLWRFLHVQMVERIIGPQTGGTGGTLGAKYLQRTLQQRFFPRLWEVRSKVFGARPAGA